MNAIDIRDVTVLTPLWMAERMMVKSTIAVASLKMLSPSTIVTNLFGAPISLNKAMTATGSVAEISAPKMKEVPTPSTVKVISVPPTTPAEISSPKTVRMIIGPMFFCNALISILIAASNIRIGRMIKRMMFGVRAPLRGPL